MGLFDVNMPLIYGEGKKAFVRLQLEILSKSDDESIFAWESPKSSSMHRIGLLADTPHGFKGCGQIKRGQFDSDRPPHFMTNKGPQAELLLQPELNQLGNPSSESPTKLLALQSRLILMAVALSSLRPTPDETYITAWTKNIPTVQ